MNDEWDEFPIYMGCKEIMKLGFSRATIYRWFHSDDFPPMITRNGIRVNKFKLKEWLSKQEVKRNEY